MTIGSLTNSIPDFSALKERIQERVGERISNADTDQSGGLSLEEFGSLRDSNPLKSANFAQEISTEEIFTRLDSDGDGELTKGEFQQAAEQKPAFPAQLPSNLLSVLLQTQEVGSEENPADLVGQILDSLDIGSNEDDDQQIL